MNQALSASARIKAAHGVKREHRDVSVVLDQEVASEVEKLEEQIDQFETDIAGHEAEKLRLAPELRFSDPRAAKEDEAIIDLRAKIDVLEKQRDELRVGTLMVLRFEKMDGETWAAITTRHPQRIGVTVDQLSGYDYHATAKEAAPLCGYVLGEDDAREDLEPEDWKNLFEIISGRELEWLASALWEMNDFGPRRRIDAARKASADGTGSRSS